MREYKKLQKLADKSLDQYNDKAFLEDMKSLIRQNAGLPKKAENKRRKRFLTVCAAVASALLIICSVFFFLPQKYTQIEEKHYNVDNKETEVIDLATLNNGLIKIKFENKNFEEIKMYYDSFYNEVLYYETECIVSEFENILIHIVPNPDFEYEIRYTCDKTDIVADNTLNYVEQFTEADGLYECKAYGQIDTGIEKVYFTYIELCIDKSSNFVNLVKELISKKQ